MVQEESAEMYRDYFESDKEGSSEIQLLLKSNPALLVSIFENYQLPKRDRSTYIQCNNMRLM